MLKNFIKSLIFFSVVVVRHRPALLSCAKWILERSGPMKGMVRRLVGKSLIGKPTVHISNLTNEELRVYVDINQSMDVFGTRSK